MIKVNDRIVYIKHFPDGTQRLNLNLNNLETNVNIEWNYETDDELFTLICITKHLRNSHAYKFRIVLTMNYLPNARMDRVKDESEVFTLKYFADVINWLNFDCVYVLDVHSNVGSALLNNVCMIPAKEYIDKAIKEISEENIVLYFPDEGAAKRYSDMFPEYEYCYGEKKRDWKTGKILGLEVKTNGANLIGSTVLMIDDIIAYGGSLYYSAKTLMDLGVQNIYAYATHTENSILNGEKGTLIHLLNDGSVRKLFTTDSLFTGENEHIHVMEVF